MPELQSITTDAAIPALSAILDPVLLRRHLEPVLGGLGWPEPRSVGAAILSGHPGSRYTLAIRVETGNAAHELIGKVYAAERSDVAQAMERLWRAGFDDCAECSIPRPLGFVAPLHLVLQEKVNGVPAQQFFLSGCEEDRRLAAARCARWLARFHRAGPAVGPVFRVTGHFTALDRWSRRIARLSEALGAKAARLVRSLELEARGLEETGPFAGHGSFSPGQILFASGRTVTFDWDGYDVADPARDVARFRMALRRLALGRLHSIRALDASAANFLAEYIAAGGPEVEVNLRFFEAALCLQLAKYNIAHPVTQWREKLEAMLDEGLRILEERR